MRYAFITQEAAPDGRCYPKGHGPGGRKGGPGARGGFGRFGGEFHDHPDRHGGWGGPGWGGPGGGPWGRGPGGRGPGGGPRGRGRGGRAGRGDIRAGILALLSEEPMHGYQVMRELAERSRGTWRPSPGSVYPTLQQLLDEGLVTSEDQSGGRRLFSITDDGRAAVTERGDAPAPWEEVANDVPAPLTELRDLVFQVGAATRQVVEAGSEEQAKRAVQVLKDTRRSLYRILAEDPQEEEEKPGA